MKGVFGLKTPRDLMAKLESDFARVQANSADPFAIYDFFVTAWHLVEWKHPPKAEAAAHQALLDRAPVLRVCEHLAVGAKHFEPTAAKHTSVADTKSVGPWPEGLWPAGLWPHGIWGEELVVNLDGDARDKFGEKVTVRNLAELVMDAWRREF